MTLTQYGAHPPCRVPSCQPRSLLRTIVDAVGWPGLKDCRDLFLQKNMEEKKHEVRPLRVINRGP